MKENKNITSEEVTEGIVDTTQNDVVENELDKAEEIFDELIESKKNVETCNSMEGIVSATKLNIRALPYTSASVLGVLDKGTTVVIEGEENEFYKVSANGIVGFCMKQYIN